VPRFLHRLKPAACLLQAAGECRSFLPVDPLESYDRAASSSKAFALAVTRSLNQ